MADRGSRCSPILGLLRHATHCRYQGVTAMAILLSLLLFAVLMLAIGYFGYRRIARPGKVYEQLGGEATMTMPVLGEADTADGMVVRVIRELGEKVPIDPADASLLRRDLMAAGYRSERALFYYQASRVIAIAVL